VSDTFLDMLASDRVQVRSLAVADSLAAKDACMKPTVDLDRALRGSFMESGSGRGNRAGVNEPAADVRYRRGGLEVSKELTSRVITRILPP